MFKISVYSIHNKYSLYSGGAIKTVIDDFQEIRQREIENETISQISANEIMTLRNFQNMEKKGNW